MEFRTACLWATMTSRRLAAAAALRPPSTTSTLGISRFNGRGYYGGHYGSDNDNHYELFSAAGMDFIIIHFEYDTTPEQGVLDWADNLLTIYSDRRYSYHALDDQYRQPRQLGCAGTGDL